MLFERQRSKRQAGVSAQREYERLSAEWRERNRRFFAVGAVSSRWFSS